MQSWKNPDTLWQNDSICCYKTMVELVAIPLMLSDNIAATAKKLIIFLMVWLFASITIIIKEQKSIWLVIEICKIGAFCKLVALVTVLHASYSSKTIFL